MHPLLAHILFPFLVVFAACAQAPAGEPIEAQGPVGTLRGTLLAASGETDPVVLIVPGSGPTDRDGNSPAGVNAATYRLLAEGLAERGVASVRIDKRGMFASAAEGVDPNNVVIADYAEDVRAWIDAVRLRTGAECVWIAGHSEGALVVSVAAQSAAHVCGLILIAGPGRRLSDVLREQLASNPANAPLLADAERIIVELEAGRTVEDVPPALRALFRPSVQRFVISLFSYDPAELLRGYDGPVLVMQGETDLQVRMQDAERLASARPGIELARLEGVNHVLKQAPAERNLNLATYSVPGLPLAPGVAERIASFISANARD